MARHDAVERRVRERPEPIPVEVDVDVRVGTMGLADQLGEVGVAPALDAAVGVGHADAGCDWERHVPGSDLQHVARQ